VACTVPIAEPIAEIPEAAPVSVAVEFRPDVLVNLLWLALPVALPFVPSAAVALGALLSTAGVVLVSVALAPLLSVLFFTAFVFVAIVVVVSCAATVQAMRAATSMDEYRILSSEGGV